MEVVFIEILNMSFTASIVACVVILARLLFRRAPKIFSYALWAVVLFRLICPFSFESIVSLMPSKPNPIPQDIVYQTAPRINSGIVVIDDVVSDTLTVVVPEKSMNLLQNIMAIGSFLWIFGAAALLGYALFGYVRLRLRLKTATHIDGNIYETDRITTPFVLGFIKPRIYLPVGVQNMDYILEHERTHIKRRDHLIKPFAFLALCLHWFNPVVWLSYFLMCRDMEMSCDESVIRRFGGDIRAKYSGSLLEMSVRQSGLLSPLAFGESNTKSRVKNVLNYKKPAFWIIALSVVAVLVVTVAFASDRAQQEQPVDTVATQPELKLEVFVWRSSDDRQPRFAVFHGLDGEYTRDEIFERSYTLKELNLYLVGEVAKWPYEPVYLGMTIFQMNEEDYTKEEMEDIRERIEIPCDNYMVGMGAYTEADVTSGDNDVEPDNTLPEMKDLSVVREGEHVYLTGYLQTSNLGYAIYVLEDFEFTSMGTVDIIHPSESSPLLKSITMRIEISDGTELPEDTAVEKHYRMGNNGVELDVTISYPMEAVEGGAVLLRAMLDTFVWLAAEDVPTNLRAYSQFGGGYSLAVDGVAMHDENISADFGVRMHPVSQTLEFHNGVDIATPAGTNVLAVHRGVVTALGADETDGNYIMLDHGGGRQTYYASLYKFADGIALGVMVQAGDIIGYVGSSGKSTGPHLHFSSIVNGEYVNPITRVGLETEPALEDYKTEADFLNSVEGIDFQTAAYLAAKALLSADADELAKYMLNPDDAEKSVRGISNIFDDLEYIILVWSLDSIKSDTEINASYRYLPKGEDSVSYVTLEMVKDGDEWKVRWLGLEK